MPPPAPQPLADAKPQTDARPAILGDVIALIDQSRPRPGIRQAGRAILILWVAALIGPAFGLNAAALESVALLGTLAMSIYFSSLTAAARRENVAVDDLEGLVALRRTDEAAGPLQRLMSKPMRVAENRLRAMLLLGSVLARMDRHDDALTIFDTLIDREGLAGPGGATVKLARAHEMLRADRLYDADRAINDLRRLLDRGGVTAEVAQFDDTLDWHPDPAALAGLRLLELHRDIKTGHNAEALLHFTTELNLLRKGLGHRVADAHALAAIAAHRMNEPMMAQHRFADATALAPLSELVKRYGDLWPLCGVYPPTQPPR